MIAFAWFVSCAPPDESATDPPPEIVADACEDANYVAADSFLLTWCTSCHSSQVVGDDRYGAPPGVNFDIPASLADWADAAADRTSDGSMPPAGGPSDEERQALVDWVACDLPGLPDATTVADPCDLPTAHPGPAFASDSPCEGVVGMRIDGDLTVDAAADLSCVCDVAGSLACSAPTSASMGRLQTVGGGVDVSACTAASLPVLAEIGDNLHAAQGPLSVLTLPWLTNVAGEVRIADLPTLKQLRFFRLRDVGASLVVEGMDALEDLDDWSSLKTVGGDLRLEDLSSMQGTAPFLLLDAVGGELRVSELPSATVWAGLEGLRDAPNVAFTEMNSVPDLATWPSWTGGVVEFRGLASLTDLPEIGSDAVLESVTLADLPALVSVDGFGSAESMGRLDVARCSTLPDLSGLDKVTIIRGDLVLHDLSTFNDLGLDALEVVEGDMILTEWPSLSLDGIVERLAGIDVGGTVTLVGLGP